MTEIKSPDNESGPHRWLARAAMRWPRQNALIGSEAVLTFAALSSRAEVLGWRMAAVGEPLALAASCRLDLALGIHAAVQQGVAVLPVDRGWSRGAVSRLMGDCGIEHQFECRGQQAGRLVPVRGAADPAPGAIALLVPGSGSGGVPRAVMLSHANLRAAVLASARRLPLHRGDLWLACLPLGHVGGLSILLRCVQAGAGVLLHEGFDASRVWRDLRSHPVSHISLVPAMLYRLLESAGEQAPPASLRVVLVGGAALDPSLARRARLAGWPLCVSYGMSETASQVATRCGADAGLQAGEVGQPLEGFELVIGNPDSRGVGRIRLRGPAVMAGYARPGLAPGLGLDQGWLASGDLGRLRDDGALEVVGRADDLLISGGEQIHPAQVEPLLLRCPGIGEAVLSAHGDPVWGDLLVAVYTGPATPADVAAFCRRQFQGVPRPRRFLRRDALPLGRSGKVDRRKLRQQVEAFFGTADGE